MSAGPEGKTRSQGAGTMAGRSPAYPSRARVSSLGSVTANLRPDWSTTKTGPAADPVDEARTTAPLPGSTVAPAGAGGRSAGALGSRTDGRRQNEDERDLDTLSLTSEDEWLDEADPGRGVVG